MATTIGTLTIKGNDLGNYATGAWGFLITNTWSPFSSGGGGFNNSYTISAMLDEFISVAITPFYGVGAVTYTLDGPSTWNSGTDTKVTMTFNLVYNGEDNSPLYIQYVTADYSYAFKFQYETPTVCLNPYELTLTACQSNYVIPSGLIPSITYYFAIETNRGKRYVQAVSTNGSGDILLWSGAPEFPEGFFTPEMFTYTCKAYTDSALTNQVQFTIDNIIYNTINLKFINTIIVSD